MFSSVREQSASSEDSRGEEDVFVDCEGRAWQEGEGLSGRGPSPHAWHTQARPRTWPRSPELPRSSCPGLPGSPLTFAGVSAAGKVCHVGDPRPQSVFFFYVFILKRLSIYIGSCKDNREKLSAPPAAPSPDGHVFEAVPSSPARCVRELPLGHRGVPHGAGDRGLFNLSLTAHLGLPARACYEGSCYEHSCPGFV